MSQAVAKWGTGPSGAKPRCVLSKTGGPCKVLAMLCITIFRQPPRHCELKCSYILKPFTNNLGGGFGWGLESGRQGQAWHSAANADKDNYIGLKRSNKMNI